MSKRSLRKGRRSRQLFPTLAAVSGACGLIAGNACALELGEIQVESSLGQPLRASIAYALNPNEQLDSYCIYLRSGLPGDGLPSLTRARISAVAGTITLTGSVPIREPLLAMQLTVNCPYTAHLARSYTLMIDPAASDAADSVSAPRQTVASEPGTAIGSKPTPVIRPRGVAPTNTTPIAAGSRYLVQPGDSLTAIVARVSDRPAGLWPAAESVFAANPDAFIGGDMNLLKAGSVLSIPQWNETGGAAGVAKTDPQESASPVLPPAEDAYSGYESEPREAASPSIPAPMPESSFDTAVTGDAAVVAAPDVPAQADTIGAESMDQLRPGDVFVTPDGVSEQGPETTLTTDNEARTGSQPGATDQAGPRGAVVVTGPADAGSTAADSGWTWLRWLAGTGIALIIGLLLFGRTLRARFGSTPVGAGTQSPRAVDADTDRAVSATDVDFDFADATVGEQSMTLDADLGAGTGLRDGADIDVAEDFTYSASTDGDSEFDLELPEGSDVEQQHPTTNVIPPRHAQEGSILESEIPPSDDGTEYDMSMIVDATKQALGDTDTTAKDLMAIQIDAGRDAVQSDDYTLSKELDYHILEQDYEEEITATQALNHEIARVAQQLAENPDDDAAPDDTSEVPTSSYAEITGELTARLPQGHDPDSTAEITANLKTAGDAENEEFISDLDDTGINEELTLEMPDPHDAATVEMQIESGKVNTRRTKIS